MMLFKKEYVFTHPEEPNAKLHLWARGEERAREELRSVLLEDIERRHGAENVDHVKLDEELARFQCVTK